MESKVIFNSDLEKEQAAQNKTFRAFRHEEEYWRLKSRSLWLKAGDRNTSYFHRQCRARLSQNHISEIASSDGTIHKGFEQLKEAAEKHFQSLYKEEDSDCEETISDYLSHIPSLVSRDDNADLMKLFTEEEICNVIWSMEPDKAPGPDGFSIHFYRACWDIIKIDLLKMIKAFHKRAKVGGNTNSTFLALIPKEVNPSSFERFRPISLCNASYKIMSKLLENRIKPLLENLISPMQGGFFKGRHILDNVIQVQEAMHSSHQRQEQGMLIKLDMENAFDRVNLSFLYKVLLSFGFCSDFVNLIKACTENPWIAPLVNGRPTNYFQASRGLRQGFPLSPFLYILMADTLSRKLTAEKKTGSVPGIRLTKGLDPINHALFADDSLMLGGASIKIAKNFSEILQSFCSISRALINKRKSAVYGWNADQQTIQRISLYLGFSGYASWEKIKYLGLPLTLGSNKSSLWTEIISKFKAKITAWGGQWLSNAGKLTLIKSILSSLPIYQASFLLAPKAIMSQITKMIRDFLWRGGKGNQKKYHLVNWETVKHPYSDGGLQVRDPELANLALGGGNPLEPICKSKASCKQSLRKKYLDGAPLRNLQAESTPKGTLIWNLCRRGLDSFQKHLYRIPGNGKNTMLWQDNIMGNAPLNASDELKGIREWLSQRGFIKLADISAWDASGSWQDMGPLRHSRTLANAEIDSSLAALTDLAPVHLLLPR
jgi:hypothetical protein